MHTPVNEFKKKSRPTIVISGDNLNETRQLAQSIFPSDPAPEIKKKNFNKNSTSELNRAKVMEVTK